MPSSSSFCRNGCEHAYEHERTCVVPTTYARAPDPAAYAGLSDAALVEAYASLHADFARYCAPAPDGHRPTYVEAGRRLGLAKAEVLRRMNKKPEERRCTCGWVIPCPDCAGP